MDKEGPKEEGQGGEDDGHASIGNIRRLVGWCVMTEEGARVQQDRFFFVSGSRKGTGSPLAL